MLNPRRTVEFSARPGRLLRVLIDGVDLIDLLREYEYPLAAHGGNPDGAGSYIGIPLEWVVPPSRHLLGETDDPSLVREGRVALLGCPACGAVECGGFFVRVVVQPDVVIWQDMLSPSQPRRWRYDRFGPFTFEREAYELAVQKLASVTEPD